MIKKGLISWIRRIKTTSLSNFPKNNVNLPELKICRGIARLHFSHLARFRQLASKFSIYVISLLLYACFCVFTVLNYFLDCIRKFLYR